jgi:hypothetical protein
VFSVTSSLFGWLVADGWCWFVLREEYCWLVAGGWFVLREKYCWLVADKPSEQAADLRERRRVLVACKPGHREGTDKITFGHTKFKKLLFTSHPPQSHPYIMDN